MTLGDAAAAAGLGRFRLVRLFRERLGLTPHAYRTGRRVEAAKAMLREGAPPAKVALATGFADQAHLTRRFRQLTGTTPTRYAAASGWKSRASSRGAG